VSLFRRRVLPFLGVLAATAASACSDPNGPHPTPIATLDAAEQQVSSSGNDFSFALFQQLAKSQAGKNVFVSTH